MSASTVTVAQDRALKEQPIARNRIALLVGNGDYDQKPLDPKNKPLSHLNNPCNDITRISAVLESAGWLPRKEIIAVCDVRREGLRKAIDQFKDAYLSESSSFGFVYYAGHGIQVRNDTYLFGIDSSINVERAANTAAEHPMGSIFIGGVRLFGDLISQVGDAGSGSIFIVVDACRETPIDKHFKALGKINPYLTSQYPKPALGIKLLYSTTYGELASDGITLGSPFALAFEQHLKTEGRIEKLVSHVIQTVSKSTENLPIRQLPDTTGALNPPPPEGCLTQCGENQ